MYGATAPVERPGRRQDRHRDAPTTARTACSCPGNGRGAGTMTRRTVLVTSALVAVLSGGMGWLGQQSPASAPAPRTWTCPPAADRAEAARPGPGEQGQGHLEVPDAQQRLLPRRHEPHRPGGRPRQLDARDRRRRRQRAHLQLRGPARRWTLVERDITLTCVSNDVGGPYVGAARWLGVPPQATCSTRPASAARADQILTTDVDGMTISTPLDVALDGRDAMIAIGMNGEALPAEHGFPARLVVPGLYGFVGATKWMTRMTLTTYDAGAGLLDRARLGDRRPDQDLRAGSTPRRPFDDDRGRRAPSSAGVAWAQTPRHRARSRSASTAAPGSRPSSARAPASTTGASGTCRWDADAGPAHASRSARPARRRGADPGDAPARSPTAPAASRRSSSTSTEPGRSPDSARQLADQSGQAPPAPNHPDDQHHTTERLTHEAHHRSAPDRRRPLALDPSLGLAACGGDERRRHPAERRHAAADDHRVDDPPMEDDLATRRPLPRPSVPAARPIPTDGDGSFDGMATDRSPPPPAPTRCSRPWSPPSTEADLVDTLNSAPALTVFAPANDAFARSRRRTSTPCSPTRRPLTRSSPTTWSRADRARTSSWASHETLAGDTLTVKGSGEDATIGDEKATVHLRQHPDGQRDGLRHRHRPDALIGLPLDSEQARIRHVDRSPRRTLRRPLPEGAPARPTWPSCSAARRAATRAPSPGCTTPPQPRVYGLALRVVRDPAQAEEVTQEAFLEIWRHRARFDADRGQRHRAGC